MVDLQNYRLEKHSLRVMDLSSVPAIVFVEELDLNENDKREISNPAKEGWVIAYIDSFRKDERKKIDSILRSSLVTFDLSHFNNIQLPWVRRSNELYAIATGKSPNCFEAVDAYTSENSMRYRMAYPLLFPEMQTLKSSEKLADLEENLLVEYFKKAEEASEENYKKHGPKGLNDLQRTRWANAKKRGNIWIYEPCYAHFAPQQ